MSDPHSHHDALPDWAADVLRGPVRTDARRKRAIMDLVRANPLAHQRPDAMRRARRPWRGTWRRRLGLAPAGGLAVAAGLAGIMTLGVLRAPTLGGARGPATVRGIASDSLAVGASALRDTLRLVRFALAAPSAARVALVGDFNAWSAAATPLAMVAESTGVWAATVAVRPGAYRYAYVVDDTQWTADPRMQPARGDSGVLRTVFVPDSTN